MNEKPDAAKRIRIYRRQRKGNGFVHSLIFHIMTRTTSPCVLLQNRLTATHITHRILVRKVVCSELRQMTAAYGNKPTNQTIFLIPNKNSELSTTGSDNYIFNYWKCVKSFRICANILLWIKVSAKWLNVNVFHRTVFAVLLLKVVSPKCDFFIL